MHVCAQQRQKDEDMKRGQDRTKVCVVAMKGNQVHRDPTSLSNLGDLKPGSKVQVDVRVHTKARTEVCANDDKT